MTGAPGKAGTRAKDKGKAKAKAKGKAKGKAGDGTAALFGPGAGAASLSMPGVGPAAAPAPPVVARPDAGLLETARTRWQYGAWEDLAAIDLARLADHPDRSRLALLTAAGHMQSGAPDKARQAAQQALAWGAGRGLTARVLLAALHNTLGRVAALLGEDPAAADHFRNSLGLVEPQADLPLLARTRHIRELARLGLMAEAGRSLQADLDALAPDAPDTPARIEALRTRMAALQEELTLARQPKPTRPPARGVPADGAVQSGTPEHGPIPPQSGPAAPAPVAHVAARLGPTLELVQKLAIRPAPQTMELPDVAALLATLETSLADPGTAPEAIDDAAARLPPGDAALLLMLAAAYRTETGDKLLALDLMADAEDLLAPDGRAQGLLSIGADIYLRLKEPAMAVALMARAAVKDDGVMEPGLRQRLDAAIHASHHGAAADHGHVVLIDWLAAHPPAPTEGSRARLMVEIGTTRERVPGQGSTEKLAQVCAARGFDFVTVDMDPRNAARAQRMFARLGLPFRAVAAKGEDWLASFDGQVDYIFLDAYDFDHGLHSEIRQKRYETYLGARIDEEQCHQMHLDCAGALVTRLAADGLICFDDTWTDAAGHWTAKGTTAMPFLLANGFRLLQARNRAALLARG